MNGRTTRAGAVARSAVAVATGLALVLASLAILPRVPDLPDATASEPPRVGLAALPPAPPEHLGLAALFAPEPDLPQRFLRSDARDAAATCAALAAAGFPNSGWTKSRVAPGNWECYAVTGDAARSVPYSLFYMLRGSAGRIKEMRLKLTLHEESTAGALRTEVRGFLDAFAAAAQVAFPPAFVASVNARRWATYVSPRATYTFAREDGALPQWNLSVAFAGPAELASLAEPLSLPLKAVRGLRARGADGGGAPVAEH